MKVTERESTISLSGQGLVSSFTNLVFKKYKIGVETCV